MTRDLLIGIDAGTSVIKAVAFSLAGEQIAVAARPNVYQTLGGGQVEQDMHRTWADCAATLRELTERVPNLARRVAALAVTAQGDGTWLIDATASRSAAGCSGSIPAPPAWRRIISKPTPIASITPAPALASTPAWLRPSSLG